MKASSAEDFSTIGLQVMDMELNNKRTLIDNFLYSCSHSIRSPLKTMEGLVRLVKEYPVASGSDWLQYVNMLTQSVERMHEILEHFHQLRMNAELCSAPQRVQLPVLLAEVLEGFKQRINENDIVAQFHINQKGALIIDKWRLETILKTLISNAVGFCDARKTTRELSIFVTASSSSCSIQVHDNGIGIEFSEQERIFNLFYRATDMSKGAGMGLFVARQLTEKINGTISVESVPRKGSVFSVWLPGQLVA